MIYKNIFTKTAFIALLAIPNLAFSGPTPVIPDDTESSGFYISFAYNPAYENFGNVEVFNSKKTEILSLVSLTKDFFHDTSYEISDIPLFLDDTEPYIPKYKNSQVIGSAALGYDMGSARIELEGSYARFTVEDKDYTVKNNARTAIIFDAKESKKRKDNVIESFLLLKNNDITTTSVMVNAYYDIISENIPIAPYIGAGVGMDMIKFFDKTRYAFAYQGKIGVSWAMASQLVVFAGGYYHSVYGDEFKEIKALSINNAQGDITDEMITLKMPYAHYGFEVGVRINFN